MSFKNEKTHTEQSAIKEHNIKGTKLTELFMIKQKKKKKITIKQFESKKSTTTTELQDLETGTNRIWRG